jgi:hypothetical protein
MFIPPEQERRFSLVVLARVNLTDPDNPLESRQISVDAKGFRL